MNIRSVDKKPKKPRGIRPPIVDDATVLAHWTASGYNLAAAGETLGYCPENVRYRLRKMGVEIPKDRPRPHRPRITDEVLLATHAQNRSSQITADLLGYKSAGHVRRRLTRLGAPNGKPGPKAA
jgi:hypothetical protein